MKYIKSIALVSALILLLSLVACAARPAAGSVSPSPSPSESASPSAVPSPSPSTGQIYLYGEAHAEKKILDKEFELWNGYYHDKNMRHLFVELPSYTAAYLNMWMQADNDDIFDQLYADAEGTQWQSPDVKEFYQEIKSACPETIFHGTDVGHQYDTIGARYLKYLEDQHLESSLEYQLTQEVIEQGKYYYANSDEVYRENKMAENFIREFDNLKNENIMGIYGAAHTGLDALDFTKAVPCMANQLHDRYGDHINSVDLSVLMKETEPSRTDTFKINTNDYEASYFGKEDVSAWSKEYVSCEFWRLENAYDDFKDSPKTGSVVPCSQFPMPVETGQVIVVDWTKKDGSVERKYYRADGNEWKGLLVTEEFKPFFALKGMSPEETVRYYFTQYNNKDQTKLDSVVYEKMQGVEYEFDDLNYVKIISIEEKTDPKPDLTSWDDTWYPDPYGISVVDVTFEVNYKNGGGSGFENGKQFQHFWLVKKDADSDWMIVMWGMP